MTTPPHHPDPFATPDPQGPAAVSHPSAAPPPQATPPGWQPLTVPPDNRLTKIAPWAIALTGLYTLVTIATALTAPGYVDSMKEALGDPVNADPFATTNVVSLLSTPVQIASYVLLALWMWRLRTVQRARGADPGGVPAVEWWGWFVPLANLVLPFLGMRALTRRTVALGMLVGWWILYVASSLVAGIGTFMGMFGALDFSTGEYTNLERLDVLVPTYWISGLLLLGSWAFLVAIIRTATAKERA